MIEHNSALAIEIDSLDEFQRKATEWVDGPLIVLAGPGAGKTKVLTTRVAKLLQESPLKPFRILAITFTNRAADEMRERLERLAPPESEARLWIGTFHSFCAEVLRQNGRPLQINSDFRIYSTDRDRQEILRDALSKCDVDAFNQQRIDPTKLLPLIDRFKGDLVAPDEVSNHISDPVRASLVSQLYAAYDSELATRNALDFNSLVFKAYELFHRFPALAKRYQVTYKYWCVDEFQDTNKAQYQLLAALASGGFRNVFVVADDDQVIYQWNGASYTRLDEFSREFNPDVLQLPTNYRGPARIVELANCLVQHNVLRRKDKQPTCPANPLGDVADSVRVLRFADQQQEAAGVADVIASDRGAQPKKSFAVLARTRQLLEGVQSALAERGVPCKIVQRRDDFLSLPFKWIQATLRLAIRRTDESLLEPVVAQFNELSASDISMLDVTAEANAKNGDFLKAWLTLATKEPLGNEERQLLGLVDISPTGGGDVFWNYWDKAIKVFDAIEARGPAAPFSDYSEDKEGWRDIAREIRNSAGHQPGIDVLLQELDLRSKQPLPKSGDVLLMTIHSSKGNEFDNVYLIGVAEEILPSFQSLKGGNRTPEVEEERRNCFVAITRAREHLTMSYAGRYRGWPKQPSRFLTEMGVTA